LHAIRKHSLTPNQILTEENDVKTAIKQPLGYAIYSSLYQIRDPDAWQRMIKSDPAVVRDRPFDWSALKKPRRAFGDLKTHASRYITPSASTKHLSGHDSTLSHSYPTQLREIPRLIHTRFWPSTPTELSDKSRMKKILLSSDITPLSGPSNQATYTRGYQEGAYVTILKPGAVSSPVKRMMARNNAEKRVRMRVLDDEESGTTAWPQPD
jgi:hypothetical protein